MGFSPMVFSVLEENIYIGIQGFSKIVQQEVGFIVLCFWN